MPLVRCPSSRQAVFLKKRRGFTLRSRCENRHDICEERDFLAGFHQERDRTPTCFRRDTFLTSRIHLILFGHCTATSPGQHSGLKISSSNVSQTGKPKCIVHSAGVSNILSRCEICLIRFQGALLKVKVDSCLQHDIRRTDVVFQYTTVGSIVPV